MSFRNAHGLLAGNLGTQPLLFDACAVAHAREAYKQRETNCVLMRKQTFKSSAGPRFAGIGLLQPPSIGSGVTEF